MSHLDDDQLAEQLRRRAAGSATASELARVIEQTTAGVAQERARPWDRWRGLPRPSRAIGVPAISAALVLVLVAVAMNAGRPQVAEPGPSTGGGSGAPTSTWLLDLAQLEQVLDRIDAGGADVGKVIVARVAITEGSPVPFKGTQLGASARPNISCVADGLPGSTCSVAYRIDGSDPSITVVGVPDTVPCATGRCVIATSPGPFALGLHAGHVVQYISPVRLRDDGGVPWAVDDFIDTTSTEPMVVDGWLSGIGPLPCPLDPNTPTGFECGPASWVTASPFDANVIPPPSSDGGFGFAPPARGIRVQNAASTIAGSASGLPGDATSVPGPRRGLFLLNRVDMDPTRCFLCSSATAFLAAEVEPVRVDTPTPTSDAPTPFSSPSLSPTVAYQSLTRLGELATEVRAAKASGTGVGQVIVTDAMMAAGGPCSGPPDPASCYLIIAGTEPPIRVMNPPAGWCPSTWRCLIEGQPYIPTDGPFALRLRGDGNVDWVDWVVGPAGSESWTYDAFRDRLAHLQPTEIDAYHSYVVTGWITFDPAIYDCVPGAFPDSRFGCEGQVTWLLGTPGHQGPFSRPTNAIRLQNGAIASLGAMGRSAGLAGFEDTFLIRPVIPAPTACLQCPNGLAAELVAALGPKQNLVATQPPPSVTDLPSPGASLSAEATYAKAYAVKFEQSRATGDWAEAWLLLGSKSKAAFGSLQSFEDAEAAYNSAGATTYEIAAPVQDPAFLSESYLGDFYSDIVISTAWFVGVNHPNVDGASAALEGLVVGSGTDGDWHVWIVH